VVLLYRRCVIKTIGASILSDLSSKTLTWALCFKFTTPAGYEFGFSSHDQSLTYNGLTYAPGADPTEFTFGQNGFISNLDISLLLSDDVTTGFNRNALIAGYYDRTAYEVFVINWANPADKLIFQSGLIGNVSISQRRRVVVELRSLTQILSDQPIVRLFTPNDPVNLGDAPNGLSLSAYTTKAIVNQVTENRTRFRLSQLSVTPYNDEIDFLTGATLANLSADTDNLQITGTSTSGRWYSPQIIFNLPTSAVVGDFRISAETTAISGGSIIFSVSNTGVSGTFTSAAPNTWIALTSSSSVSSNVYFRAVFTRVSGGSPNVILSSMSFKVKTQATYNWMGANRNYSYGEVIWNTGNNYLPSTTSAKFIRNEIMTNSANTVTLLASTPQPIQVNDFCEVILGYDGSIEQAVNKFDNIINFRGFPDIPGNDAITARGEVE